MNISVDDHPLLDPVLFRTLWPAPLGELDTLPDLARWFSGDAVPPIDRPDDVKAAVRDLLRHGGFKPSGRSKPASEYLVKAAERGVMGSINPAVDCCNVASLWSGLPILSWTWTRARVPGGSDWRQQTIYRSSTHRRQEINIGGPASASAMPRPAMAAVRRRTCQRA